MLVLLPPSEGKTAGSGPAFALDELSLPALEPVRRRVLDALVRLCGDRDPAEALAALKLSARQQDEISRNAALRHAPTAEAGQVYTGVLYAALDLASLPEPAARLAAGTVLVSSGLWGVVRLTDRIPAYRCPIGASLPDIGALGTYWRRHLATVLIGAAGDGPVLDLRSGAYAATWKPRGEVAARTATVRVLHERIVDGQPVRTVVSHFNKATKGRLVRDLLLSGARPGSLTELVSALKDLDYPVETPPGPAGEPLRLDVVVTEL